MPPNDPSSPRSTSLPSKPSVDSAAAETPNASAAEPKPAAASALTSEGNGSDSDSSGRAARWAKRLLQRPLQVALAGLRFWRLAIGTALVFLALHLFGLFSLPFPPFVTRGTIYVDSPEVYTRERLVNDRYDQDWWLREQLHHLDKTFREGSSASFLQRSEQQETDVAATLAPDGAAPESDAAQPASSAAEPPLTFEQRFRIVAGIRDQLRQQILENMLDDRHDLTGNSVFGLKFDTTVIPGGNTRERAFVDVVLVREDLYAAADTPMPAAMATYLDQQRERLSRRKPSFSWTPPPDWPQRLANHVKQESHYRDWLEDIGNRLNEAEDSLFRSMGGCRPDTKKLPDANDFYNRLSGRTLAAVLGITEERFLKLDSAVTSPYIKLPAPWSDLLTLRREKLQLPAAEGKHCLPHVWFDVAALYENLTARPAPMLGSDPQTPPAGRYLIGETEDGRWELWVDTGMRELRRVMFATSEPKYRISSAFVDALCDVELAGSGETEAQADGFTMNIPSGFFNFVDRMAKFDAYPYAIFPKNDVVGIFSEVSSQLAGSGQGTLARMLRRVVESRTVSTLAGYGHGRPDPGYKRAVRFGWVISPLASMQPTLKSQLALVSVPAWTDSLTLKVTTGWIGNNGKPIASTLENFEMLVNVPPDYEAFDTIFLEDAGVNRGPSIQEDQMESRLYVEAGREESVSILIAGTRLWRSANVTLGADTAQRIRVLPNMEGIIAEFRNIQRPLAGAAMAGASDTTKTPNGTNKNGCQQPTGKNGLAVEPVSLRVWTSEGVATAPQPVCVLYSSEYKPRIDANADSAETEDVKANDEPANPDQAGTELVPE
ncbi:MAG: hypothetical protein N838_27220 [Thiohalocapsa sp. PB-PSB1]|jgi:hypothetical protein|nr:MAG: hypothetical protein N838_27220 [Thiohalocapsa sp. PB-PSB1]